MFRVKGFRGLGFRPFFGLPCLLLSQTCVILVTVVLTDILSTCIAYATTEYLFSTLAGFEHPKALPEFFPPDHQKYLFVRYYLGTCR